MSQQKELVIRSVYPLTCAEGQAAAGENILFAPHEDPGTTAPAAPALVFAMDKPYGKTSFQLVAKARWLLTRALGVKKIKVGHAGTLDPLATGVMVICAFYGRIDETFHIPM